MNMGTAWITGLVFRPPRPPTYTDQSLYPKMYFKETRLGIKIPICVNFPSRPGLFRRALAIEPDQKWILFSHGNAEDLGNATLWTNHLSEAGSIVVLSYDYSGYGLSYRERPKVEVPTGEELDVDDEDTDAEEIITPSEDSLYADCEAVIEFAENELGLKRENAILWGRSLGCSACCHIAQVTRAQGRTVGGVILQSAFTSIFEVVTNSHLENPPKADMFRNFDKVKAMKGFGAPSFVIHGTNDWIVNCWHGREFGALIPPEEQWPPLFVDSGHNDLEHTCERFVHEIVEFVEYCSLRLTDSC